MNTNRLSDGVLVYDRYFSSRPNPVLLVIKKLLLCCGLSASGMMFILTEYAYAVSLPLLAGVTVGVTILLSLVFVFLKRRYTVPALLATLAIIIFFNNERLHERFTYMADAFLLLLDGRFFTPGEFLTHHMTELTARNSLYMSSVTWGLIALCCAFALIVSASFAKRPRILPALLAMIVMCVPLLISERLEFNLWLVAFLAFAAATAALSVSYRGGLAVRQTSGEYNHVLSAEEKEFTRTVRRADYHKRVKMNAVHYSKYLSVGLLCAGSFAAAALIGAVIFPKGSSIDYSGIYDYLTNLGKESGISASPFDDGPVSEYFSHPDRENAMSDAITIVSPGLGEQEIIRVEYHGTAPLYLRGDIGVEFSGTGWSSPVTKLPYEWRKSPVAETYRPCEGRVVHSLLDARGYKTTDYIYAEAVNIDYLCETSVVFLPAYTAEFSYYSNEMFDVYGDFVVRVNEEHGNVSNVQCTAVIPRCTNTDVTDSDNSFAQLAEIFDENGFDINSLYGLAVPEMERTENVINDYRDFVFEVYTPIPYSTVEAIGEFMRGEGLGFEAITLEEQQTNPNAVYVRAAQIADYLRKNYTYSLTAENDLHDPVMSFLEKTKSGHCALYASAMTLMLREMGIPARYCTGFMVDGSRGTSVTLREKNLHAWCEVYLSGYGWVTFDPTSSSVYPNEAAPAEPQTISPAPATSSSVSESTQSSSTDTTSEHDSPAQSSTSQPNTQPQQTFDWREHTGFIAAGAVILAALIVVCIVGWLLHLLKKKADNTLRAFHKQEPNAAVEEIYALILSVLRLYKVTPQSGELPGAFYKRVDKLFETRLADDTELLEAVAFGSVQASSADREHILIHLTKLCRTAEKRSNVFRRAKLHRTIINKKCK